MELVR
jgi:hypothetical protein